MKRRRRQTGQSIVTPSLRDGLVLDGRITLVLLWNGGLCDQSGEGRYGDELVLGWEQVPEEQWRRRRLSEVQRHCRLCMGTFQVADALIIRPGGVRVNDAGEDAAGVQQVG